MQIDDRLLSQGPRAGKAFADADFGGRFRQAQAHGANMQQHAQQTEVFDRKIAEDDKRLALEEARKADATETWQEIEAWGEKEFQEDKVDTGAPHGPRTLDQLGPGSGKRSQERPSFHARLAERYRQRGDVEAAESILEAGRKMGREELDDSLARFGLHRSTFGFAQARATDILGTEDPAEQEQAFYQFRDQLEKSEIWEFDNREWGPEAKAELELLAKESSREIEDGKREMQKWWDGNEQVFGYFDNATNALVEKARGNPHHPGNNRRGGRGGYADDLDDPRMREVYALIEKRNPSDTDATDPVVAEQERQAKISAIGRMADRIEDERARAGQRALAPESLVAAAEEQLKKEAQEQAEGRRRDINQANPMTPRLNDVLQGRAQAGKSDGPLPHPPQPGQRQPAPGPRTSRGPQEHDPEVQAAIEWAKSQPADNPRARAILREFGVQ